jgi:DNA-binding NtrC family response regulator
LNAAGTSILVVEDDPSLRFVCRINLELDNFRVREADGVEQARAAVAAERPALVFLDLHLGHGDADDLLDELRADGIPVIVVSGTADVAEYEGRATALMPKPFDPADLVAAAHRHAAS